MPSVGAKCQVPSFTWNVSWKASMKEKGVGHIY